MTFLRAAVGISSLVALASAHGHVTKVVAANTYYTNYDPAMQYITPAPVVVGWSDPSVLDNGFVSPSAYANPDIICHRGASPAATAAPVAAGGIVELQWTAWPDSHHGPVIDYLAKIDGDISTVDKTTLEFFKIDQVGLVSGDNPGTWGTDQLIANNNSWLVEIPKNIAPGNYVLRHEIIALHAAGSENGAQNYPQCIDLVITGSGTDTPAGEPATSFYKIDDPGILFDIYGSYSTYQIPGPSLYSGGVSVAQSQLSWTTVAPTTKGSGGGSSPTTTTKAPSSAPSSSAPSSTTKAPSSAPTTTAKPTTLTTTTKTTAAPTTTTASSSGGTVAKYGQCGGQGYSGPTVCASGSTCTVVNPYYSQCT